MNNSFLSRKLKKWWQIQFRQLLTFYPICFFFLAVGEWLLILPRPTSLTAGFAQPLRHVVSASSSPMLPNTVLTRSQLGMAKPGFEPTTLCLDIWSGFELHFWPHKSAQLWTDPTDPLQLSVRSVQELIQASTASAILKYQPPMSTRLQPLPVEHCYTKL